MDPLSLRLFLLLFRTFGADLGKVLAHSNHKYQKPKLSSTPTWSPEHDSIKDAKRMELDYQFIVAETVKYGDISTFSLSSMVNTLLRCATSL